MVPPYRCQRYYDSLVSVSKVSVLVFLSMLDSISRVRCQVTLGPRSTSQWSVTTHIALEVGDDGLLNRLVEKRDDPLPGLVNDMRSDGHLAKRSHVKLANIYAEVLQVEKPG
jgi:hypothetical protein